MQERILPGSTFQRTKTGFYNGAFAGSLPHTLQQTRSCGEGTGMERRNLALLCAGVLCFWLFALAFGTAEGRGVAVQAELPTAAPAAVEEVHP